MILCWWVVKPALADIMKSDSYIITFGNLNTTSGKKTSTTYKMTDTVGQIGSGPYSSTNYKVGAGFQYIYQIGTFSFAISDLSIDLGTLATGAHNTDSNTLTVNAKGAGGYSVYAYEAHPLKREEGSITIADTTCDGAACSESNADPWTNQAIPGFGFNINGHDTPADFVDNTYFRQFADISNSESAKVVMSSSNVGENRVATVTYKAGITGVQAAGNYSTYIVYIAVPGY